MTNHEFDDIGDQGLPTIYEAATQTHVEHNPVKTMAYDARETVLGGLNYLREHPIGSIEVGSAIAASGVIAARLIPKRHQRGFRIRTA